MWRLHPRRPWALPSTRKGALEALEALASPQKDLLRKGEEKEERRRPRPRPRTHFDLWKETFLDKVKRLEDESDIVANARELVRQGASGDGEHKARLQSAASVYACKYFSGRLVHGLAHVQKNLSIFTLTTTPRLSFVLVIRSKSVSVVQEFPSGACGGRQRGRERV